MSYLQIEIGGKLRGWKVNMQTIEMWSKGLNFEAFSSTSVYRAVYAGLVANCEAKGEEQDFTYDEVQNWVDDLNDTEEGLKSLEEVKKAFEQSRSYVKLLEGLDAKLKTVTKEEKKKKAVRK